LGHRLIGEAAHRSPASHCVVNVHSLRPS
jgi:hypothetical protein